MKKERDSEKGAISYVCLLWMRERGMIINDWTRTDL